MKGNRKLALLICLLFFILTACSRPTPVIERMSIDPENVEPGGIVSVEVEARNPGSGALYYTWRISDGEIVGNRGSSIDYKLPDDPKQGSYKVSVIIRNNDGNQATASEEVGIIFSGLQIIELTANPKQVSSDQIEENIRIEAEVGDQGRDIDYKWEAPDGGEIERLQNDNEIDYYLPGSARSGERYKVQLTISDGMSDDVRESILIDVISQDSEFVEALPESASIKMKDDQVQEFSIIAMDRDGYDLDYEWLIMDDSGFSSVVIESSDDSNPEYITILEEKMTDVNGETRLESKMRLEPAGLRPGKYVVLAKVTDATRNSVEHSWELELEGDAPRFVDSNIPEEIRIYAEMELWVEVESSFATQDELDYTWEVEKGNIIGSGNSITYQAPSEVTTEELTIKVDDGHGGISEQTLEIEIISEPVKINSVIAEDSRIKINEDTIVTVDYEADTFDNRYRWRIIDEPVEDAGQIEGDGEQVRFNPLEAGSYTVEIRVIDELGAHDTKSIDIIVEYLDPEVGDISFEEVIKRDQSSQFILNNVHNPNSGADANDLDYDWYISGDIDSYIEGAGEEATFNPDKEIKPGTYDVGLRISYGSGVAQAAITKSFEVKVESLDPQVTEVLALEPSTIYNDGSINLSIGVENPNPDASEDDLNYQWQLNGQVIESQYLDGSGSSVTYQPEGSISAGTHELGVVISDGRGGEIERSADFEVKNRPPKITSINLSSSIRSDSNTRIRVEVENLDRDQLSYTYRWAAGDKGGTIVASTESDRITYEPQLEALADGLVIKGQHTITVIVDDGSGGEDTKQATLEVTNTPPIIERFFVDEGESILGFGDTVELRVEATDIDDDDNQLSYEWRATEGTTSGSGSRVDYTAPNNATTDRITVTVSDPAGDETESQIELEIKDIWQQTLDTEKLTGIIKRSLGGYKAVTVDGQLLELNDDGSSAGSISLDEDPDKLNDIISVGTDWFVAGRVFNDGYYGNDDDSTYLINDPEVKGLTGDGFGGLIFVGEKDGQGYVWADDTAGPWEQSYSSVGRIEGITRGGSGYYVLVGGDRIIEIDENGNEISSTRYGSIGEFRDIEAIGGDYLVVGQKNNSAYIAKLDDNFDKVWEKELVGDILTSAVEDNGYYILVGEYNGKGYIVKMDQDGNTALNLK